MNFVSFEGVEISFLAPQCDVCSMELFSYKSRPSEVTRSGADGCILDRNRLTARQAEFKQLPRNKCPYLTDHTGETRQPY